MKNLILVCLLCSINTVAQISQSCLITPSGTNIPSGYTYPNAITTNDFNSDGKFDLAVANSGGGGMLSVLIGNGNATFANTVNYPVNSSVGGIGFVVSDDFNNDGKIDLVTAGSATNKVSFYAGTGLGTFLAPIHDTINVYVNAYGYYVTDLTSVDINGDGNIDLASIVNTATVSVMLGNGNGTFAPSVFYLAGSNPSSIENGDFNSDGISDLVITNKGSNNISVFLGSVSGTLSPAVNYTVGQMPNSVVASDLNGDNIIDLAVINGMFNNGNYVSILIGQGSGSFSYLGEHKVDIRACAVTSGDVNGDGITDLLTANPNNSTDRNCVSVLLGTGSGNFSVSTEYITDYDSKALVSKDFNNDGKMDVAVVNKSSYNITILKGASEGLESLPFYTTGYYSANLVINDFNNDGNVDIAFPYNGFKILFGGGNGRISAINSYTTADPATSLASADFNNDGNQDILLGHGNLTGSVSSVLFGTGLGTFSNPVYMYNFRLIDLRSLSDFNNDGNLDIALGSGINPNIYIYLGSGSGTFSFTTSYTTTCLPKSITSGDFDLDGKTDLIALNGCNWSNIQLFKGMGNGFFLAPTTFSAPGYGQIIKSSDLNSDGKLDIVAFNTDLSSSKSVVSVLLGTNTGSFNASSSQTITGEPYSLSVADVTEDNIPDLITASGGTLSVFQISSIGSISSLSNIYYHSSHSFVEDFNNDGKNDFGVIGVSNSSPGIGILINTIPTISLSSQNLVCLNSTVSINATGANTYTWNTGALGSSIIVSPSSDMTYTVIGSSMSSCTNSAVKTISVNPIPTILLNGSNPICIGTSTLITATGANTYTWNTGITSNSIIVSPLVTTTYTVVGTNTVNCSSTQTIEVTVDNTCQSVWPGDANSDGIADNLDILELGLHYTQTGAARTTTSNAWQAYTATNWAGTITNGKNLNHSDCNGDGTINADDTLAIYNNYGLTHTFKLSNVQSTNPVLNIIPDQNLVYSNTWGTSSVYLGDASNPMSNVNGVAFTLNYDNSLIETDSVYLEYTNSFINSGQNLHFRKNAFANSVLYTATTHTNNVNANGYGKIATLHYKIKPTLTTNATLNISATQAVLSNANGSITPITSGSASLTAMALTTQLNNFTNDNIIHVYPNPTSSELHIETNAVIENATLKLTNALGQTVLTEQVNAKQQQLSTSGLAKGVYVLELWQGNKIIYRNKLLKE